MHSGHKGACAAPPFSIECWLTDLSLTPKIKIRAGIGEWRALYWQHVTATLPIAASPAVSLPQSDAELVDRFVTVRDPAAIAELVRRHSDVVLGVCRRVLRNTCDIEDAFQATFLVLVRDADFADGTDKAGAASDEPSARKSKNGGTIRYTAKLLIIWQSQRVHDEIVELLNQLDEQSDNKLASPALSSR